MDAGDGFGLPGNRDRLTPYAGMTLGDAGTRTVRTRARWQFSPDTVVSVEATRRASDASAPADELTLRAALRFRTRSAGRSDTDPPVRALKPMRRRQSEVGYSAGVVDITKSDQRCINSTRDGTRSVRK